MALFIDVTKIKDNSEKCYDKTENGQFVMNDMTQTLGLTTMIVGINKITDKNAIEYAARLVVLQKLYGGMGPGGRFFGLDDVLNFIGLETNASLRTRKSIVNVGRLVDDEIWRLKNPK